MGPLRSDATPEPSAIAVCQINPFRGPRSNKALTQCHLALTFI